MIRPLSWVNTDDWLLAGARAVRTFAQSTISVLLAVYLSLQGLSLVQVGIFLTIGSVGATCMAILAGVFGDSFGRRRFLVATSVLMALSSIVLILSDSFVLLAGAAFVGGLGAFMGGVGPLEQAVVATSAEPRRRTELFAIVSIAGTVGTSLGALGVAIPELLQQAVGLSQISSFRAWFITYPVFVMSAALLYSRLSSHIEVPNGQQRWKNPLISPSRGRILTIAGLFTVDSFGTGMVAQSLAAYFFFTRFGLQPGALGALFFASSILTAISLWTATRLARRIGLLNTMVFTHIPSSLLLMVVPFVPTSWVAIVLWLARAFFIQMDVPTSQSYTMAVVLPAERTAMASAATVSRSAGGAAGPSGGTLLWSALGPAALFVVGGTVKVAYDLSLWFLFRRVKPPEETSIPGGAETRT